MNTVIHVNFPICRQSVKITNIKIMNFVAGDLEVVCNVSDTFDHQIEIQDNFVIGHN